MPPAAHGVGDAAVVGLCQASGNRPSWSMFRRLFAYVVARPRWQCQVVDAPGNAARSSEVSRRARATSRAGRRACGRAGPRASIRSRARSLSADPTTTGTSTGRKRAGSTTTLDRHATSRDQAVDESCIGTARPEQTLKQSPRAARPAIADVRAHDVAHVGEVALGAEVADAAAPAASRRCSMSATWRATLAADEIGGLARADVVERPRDDDVEAAPAARRANCPARAC